MSIILVSIINPYVTHIINVIVITFAAFAAFVAFVSTTAGADTIAGTATTAGTGTATTAGTGTATTAGAATVTDTVTNINDLFPRRPFVATIIPSNNSSSYRSTGSSNIPFRSRITPTVPITNTTDKLVTVSTVTVIWNDNGVNKVLIGLRGVGGHSYGKAFTFGGTIDSGESKEDCAIREAFEEGGVTIQKKDLKLLNTCANFANFYVYYCKKPTVLGPVSNCQWEILQSTKLQNDFGVSMITNNNGSNSGLAWIPVDVLLSSKLDYVKSSSSIQNIRKMKQHCII